jgi:hypothetical protein
LSNKVHRVLRRGLITMPVLHGRAVAIQCPGHLPVSPFPVRRSVVPHLLLSSLLLLCITLGLARWKGGGCW